MQQEVINALETDQTKLVIYKTGGWFNNINGIPTEKRLPLIAHYLDQHYQLATNINGTDILKRKEETEWKLSIHTFVYGKTIPSSLGLLSIFVGLDTSDLSSMLIENTKIATVTFHKSPDMLFVLGYYCIFRLIRLGRF